MISAWYFAVLLSAAPAPPAATFDFSARSPTAAQIDEYLARRKSAMAGLGQSFEGYGRDYNVDPRLIVAIAGAETTFGQHVCADRNAWNWFYRRTCPDSPFLSYEAGMERVTRFMRLSYLNRGYDSIELIRYKYCAAGCDNWVPLVSKFQAEMPVNDVLPGATNPSGPVSSVPSSGRRGEIRIFGVPVYALFFVGVLLVASWAFRILR